MAKNREGEDVSSAYLMLMLDLARAENMVAETPLRLAICCPTAASMQQLSMASMWCMRPDLMASLNLHKPQNTLCCGFGISNTWKR